MIKIHGCSLDVNNFTSFKIDGIVDPIFIIPDLAIMVKLVRNTFGEKCKFVDLNGCH